MDSVESKQLFKWDEINGTVTVDTEFSGVLLWFVLL